LALLTLVMAMVPAVAPAIGGYVTAWFGWRASFVLLAVFGGIVLLLCLLMMPETLDRPGAGNRSLVAAYLRLLRSPRFRGYAVGGACSTTSFYAFMSASPFIFERVLHESPQRIGLYYLFLMLGLVVEIWHPGAIYPVAVVLLGSALVGQGALSRAIHAERTPAR
jgi:DHA1 family bicyclomycin/chloramphenicol resistance-like MFS transporter